MIVQKDNVIRVTLRPFGENASVLSDLIIVSATIALATWVGLIGAPFDFTHTTQPRRTKSPKSSKTRPSAVGNVLKCSCWWHVAQRSSRLSKLKVISGSLMLSGVR